MATDMASVESIPAATSTSVAPADPPGPVLEDGEAEEEDGSLKRKASVDDNPGDASPKRARHDDSRDAVTESSRRSRSPSRTRPTEVASNMDQERRKLAAQEEKKRGRRLFGGLMSTLSQTSNTSQQQKRRLEIERRQQERMQKQKAEDDQRRTEKLERLREVRMAEQITFEEEVMKNKHAKRLSMARFLRTTSEPRIYYLPWKTTPGEEDIIDEQIHEAKEIISREVEQFKAQKQRHIERYGPPTRQRSPTPDEPAVKTGPDAENSVQSPPPATAIPTEEQQQQEEQQEEQQQPVQNVHDDQHDESGDVLVEAEEDMVIY